eukprot:366332-Chlamydomonas_euryale.AAC.13
MCLSVHSPVCSSIHPSICAFVATACPHKPIFWPGGGVRLQPAARAVMLCIGNLPAYIAWEVPGTTALIDLPPNVAWIVPGKKHFTG